MSLLHLSLHVPGIIDVCPTGSRIICDPPVMNTDEDYLLLVRDLDQAGYYFLAKGWVNCFEKWREKVDTDEFVNPDNYSVEIEGGARFQSWRSGSINVIVTDNVPLHLRSRAATLLARELNLTNKDDRIALFRCIKYNMDYSGRMR